MPLCNQVGQSRLAETSGVLGFGETEKPLCQALRLDKPTVVFEQVVSCFPCAGVSAFVPDGLVSLPRLRSDSA
jgi:hypothetical protein